MADRPGEDRRRQLRRDYKHAERMAWLASLPLDEPEHAALLDHLDERLGSRECDHSFRFAEQWLRDRGLEVGEVIERYELMGAGCDCEILANLDPETRA